MPFSPIMSRGARWRRTLTILVSLLSILAAGAVLVTPAATAATQPIVHRSSSTHNQALGSTTITINKPAGVVEGDFLVAQVSIGATTAASITAPTGWTSVAASNGNGNAIGTAVFRKFAGASEPTSYTFGGIGLTAAASGGISAYTGVDPTSPVAASAIQGNTGNGSSNGDQIMVAPTVNASAGGLLLAYFARAASTDIPAPAGMTQRFLTAAASPRSAGHDETTPSGVATGPRTINSGTGRWATISVALTPAPAPTAVLTTTIERHDAALPGQKIWYVVRVTNTGNADATNTRLNFTAPVQMRTSDDQYEECVSTAAGSCTREAGFTSSLPNWESYVSNPIPLDVDPTWGTAVLKQGEMWKITIRGFLDESAVVGQELTVSAEALADNASAPGASAPPAESVQLQADLAMTLTSGLAKSGKTAFYKVQVTNRGPSASADNALSATVNQLANLEYCAWNGTACTTAWTAYAGPIDIGDLALNASTTYRFRGLVTAPTGQQVSVAFAVESTDIDTADPVPANNDKGNVQVA